MVQDDLVGLLLVNAEPAKQLRVDGDTVGIPVGRGDGEEDVLLLDSCEDVVGQQDVANQLRLGVESAGPKGLRPVEIGDEAEGVEKECEGGKRVWRDLERRQVRPWN